SITDLETLRDLIVKNPGSAPDIIRFQALVALGDGYDKKGEQQKALETWRNVVELAPNTPWAEQAEKKLKSSAVRREDSKDRQKKLLNRLGATSPVIKELSGKLEKDPDNPRVLYDLAMAIGVEAEKGYDARIYEDTTFRTNIAIEMVNLLDRASKLAPDDQNIRLACGMTSVTMPFFVNRLDKGMDDLKKVIDSSAPDSLKAEAHYWLGYAYSKKATTEWIEVISKYPDSREAAMSFEEMTPQVRHFDRASHSGPVVAIDFILGFRDELAPQTAVWIVDGRGKFIRTLYVSGFSGFIREKQVNLPEWAKSSGYSDADAVTGASIDTGHHLYVWDLTDSSGKKVGSGTYTVQVEACYWPSMNYQATSIPVTIGKKEYSRTVEEGNIIPYLGVVYYP
ncbi:DUF2271 domain-containing protein, partial [bacterium]|nr:DUF2271 domain-containing protein [bacterium]